MDVWCPIAKLFCRNGEICPDATSTITQQKCAFWHDDYCLQVENMKKNIMGSVYYGVKNPKK